VTIWVALLRGINVGGKNVLKMKELATLLEGVGCLDVKTYIQSGNVAFKSEESNSAALGSKIEAVLNESGGVVARVLVINRAEFGQAMESNPFPQAEESPSALHLFFLSEPSSNPDIELLNTRKADSESFVLTDKVFYLHAPDGIGKSKLAARVERLTESRCYRSKLAHSNQGV
jgi:uncharacterized protein (DUF1697 family)